jgi:hypothetical protein
MIPVEGFSAVGWVPASGDIKNLEMNLPQISKLQSRYGSGVRIEDPERYDRQYLGFIRAGHKLIYVNASCDEVALPKNWKTHPYVVADGGTCFWQALYDPVSKTFSSLQINSRA